MEHKAYVFDHDGFCSDLRPLLWEALRTKNTRRLESFVDSHLQELKDPDEAVPLDANWRSKIEIFDVHQVGDLALTKYYTPDEDIGLGDSWMLLDNAMQQFALGRPVAANGYCFDPGKMGSYFQDAKQAEYHFELLHQILKLEPSKRHHVARMIAMFETAIKRKLGLYVTF